MGDRRFRIPSSNALVAFECVARLGGVGLAAEELNTSQSAVSRHLKRLEDELGVRLFERTGRGVALTGAGRTYLGVVSTALEGLSAARHVLRAGSCDLTIACTHEVSHLLLMPEFQNLRRAVGSDVDIRFLTSEYDAIPAMISGGADIVFRYAEAPPEQGGVAVVDESIFPVASPSFVSSFRDALARPPGEWAQVARLALTKNNFGWATWETWFAAVGASPPAAPTDTYDNYVYLLESAAAGAGLALGWKGFADRYLATGALVPVSPQVITRRTRLYAVCTAKGAESRSALTCLDFLARLFPKYGAAAAASGGCEGSVADRSGARDDAGVSSRRNGMAAPCAVP